MRSLAGDDRGVSDVLAFIMVFSLIITSVALVYGTGFSSIDQISEGEQKTNAVRAFEALELSMDDIVTGAAPRRGGSLNLGGGRLLVDDSSSATTVTVRVQTSSGWNQVAQEDTGTLEYALDETTVAYENGGLFREDRGNSVSVKEANMVCQPSSNKAVVSLVVVKSDEGAIDTQGDVEVTMVEEETTLLHSEPNGNGHVGVEVQIDDTNYDDGWEDAMNAAGWSVSGSTYTCSVDRVIVRMTVIDVTYETP